jgi:hypothetical protein
MKGMKMFVTNRLLLLVVTSLWGCMIVSAQNNVVGADTVRINGWEGRILLSPGSELAEVNCSLYAGRCDCNDASINGKSDDIGVWSRALTTTEVTELFESLQEAVIKCK